VNTKIPTITMVAEAANCSIAKNPRLSCSTPFPRVFWLDTGTHESLLSAANFIQVVEQRQGLKVCCPEEIAFRMDDIDAIQLQHLAEPLKKSGYGHYLLDLLRQEINL
jgi:dTDP-glucose pyrophosphorylase